MKSERHILNEMTTNCNCPQCRAYRRKCKHRARRAAKRELHWDARKGYWVDDDGALIRDRFGQLLG